MKKILAITSLVLVTAVALSGCASTKVRVSDRNKETKDHIGFIFGQVTDAGGVTDKSFNQGAYEGLTKFANESNVGQPQFLISKTPQEMETNLISLAGKTDVVVGSGFNFEDPIMNVSKIKKDKKFVLIDGNAVSPYPSNVANYSFSDQEAGYLVGVAAAKSTKTKKVGFIGGINIPPVQRFGWGFIKGVKDTDPSIEVKYEYTGSFRDTALGKTKAAAYYGSGVDIIFHAAGGVGVGVINEAKEQRLQNKNVYVIGVDKDQYDEGKYDGDKSVILTSAMKKVDEATYQAMRDIRNNNFAGGKTTIKSVKDGAVGIPNENPNLSAEAKKGVDDALQKIKSGSIVPPSKREDVNITSGIAGEY